MTPDEQYLAELRRRINSNMQALACGDVRRATERERAERLARRQAERLARRQAEKNMRREARAELKELKRQLADKTETRNDYQDYMDDCLENDPDKIGNGGIEELDSLIEQLTEEIISIQDQIERLERALT